MGQPGTGTLVVRETRHDGSSFVCIIADDWTPAEMAMIQFGFLADGTAVHPARHEILAYYPDIDVFTVGTTTPEDHPMWQEN